MIFCKALTPLPCKSDVAKITFSDHGQVLCSFLWHETSINMGRASEEGEELCCPYPCIKNGQSKEHREQVW